VNGQRVIGINGGADPEAVRLINHIAARNNWDVVYQPELLHSLQDHAERVLYDKYGDILSSIGLSHKTGRCLDVNGYFDFFSDKLVELAWTGKWKK
jgi:hypothetical protein